MKTITLRHAALALAFLGLSACSEAPAGPEDGDGEATLYISADVTATIAGVTIEVSAADLDQTIVVNLPVNAGAVAGTVTIPAGAERTITARAFDKGGVETHRGTTTINVEAGDNAEVTIVLEPLNGNQPIVVTFASYTITLSPLAPVLDVGATVQLTATVQDASGPVPGAQVVWGSTNPGIATVDQTGLVTAGLVGGTTTIVATYQGVAASTLVTVNPPPTMVESIAYAAFGTFGWDIFLMNPDGTGAVSLTSDGIIDQEPAISPDGQRIAFRRGEGGGLWDIWVMNVDGTNLVGLTAVGGNFCPNWSPDGTRIAFVSDRDGNRELYVMNDDGTNQVRITNNTVRDGCPSWSPDGTRLAFAQGTAVASTGDIYTINPDGTGIANVTAGTTSFTLARWSPDGTRFAAVNASLPGGLSVMNVDGSGQQLIVDDGGGARIGFASWSPDGTRIAFGHLSDIWIVNDDGTGLTNITAGMSGLPQNPSWGLVPVSALPAPPGP